MEYLIGGLALLVISSLIAVKVGLKDKVSYRNAEKRYKKIEVCDEIHKSVDEKLQCLPAIKKSVTEIETKIDMFLEKNGKK